ncbi:hypothetical protein [Zooshikella harenae]|uniref:Glycoside hydrolase n=1 Tax=Zooshikella harenae TaxID=2827238 RepID=A0ABS5ZHM8_9GAMM|nr:hypothetical protein [Zooshikella harenae]MBU2712755.1 hypothetical protein [Zooshikella harenae]
MNYFKITCFFAAWFTCAVNAMQWQWIRDGVWYIDTSSVVETKTEQRLIRLSWQPAWQPSAHEERIFLQDAEGSLIDELVINPDQFSGEKEWLLKSDKGPYRLEVPGYSYRRYRLEHASALKVVYQPVKHHFTAEVPANAKLYFSVPAEQTVNLGGKYHGGVKAFKVSPLKPSNGGIQLSLSTFDIKKYWQNNIVPIEQSTKRRVWRLVFKGKGKVAFWLDTTENVFALRPEDLFVPKHLAGKGKIKVGLKKLGPVPWVGTSLPFLDPPSQALSLLKAMQVRSATYYTYIDVLKEKIVADHSFRGTYYQQGIINDLTLLAETGRRAVLVDSKHITTVLRSYLPSWQQYSKTGQHYLVLADEPNLNYPSFTAFVKYAKQVVNGLKQLPEHVREHVKVAIPASAGWLNGPNRNQASSRRGITWAKQLLLLLGDDVHALTWHQWLIRDLRATRSYQQAVAAAASLVGRNTEGVLRKTLLIDQTNISSGLHLSPYEQDTFFAALWWVSVVVNAAQHGDLTMINWFKAADEGAYRKGLMRLDAAGNWHLKPVGHAMKFIQAHLQGEVLATESSLFEVDVLASTTPKVIHMLGVNKGDRQQKLDIMVALPKHWQKHTLSVTKTLLVSDLQPQVSQKTYKVGQKLHLNWTIPNKSIFAIEISQ